MVAYQQVNIVYKYNTSPGYPTAEIPKQIIQVTGDEQNKGLKEQYFSFISEKIIDFEDDKIILDVLSDLELPCKCVRTVAANGQFKFFIDKYKLTQADAGMHEATIEIKDKFTIQGMATKVKVEFVIKYTAATVIEEEIVEKEKFLAKPIVRKKVTKKVEAVFVFEKPKKSLKEIVLTANSIAEPPKTVIVPTKKPGSAYLSAIAFIQMFTPTQAPQAPGRVLESDKQVKDAIEPMKIETTEMNKEGQIRIDFS